MKVEWTVSFKALEGLGFHQYLRKDMWTGNFLYVAVHTVALLGFVMDVRAHVIGPFNCGNGQCPAGCGRLSMTAKFVRIEEGVTWETLIPDQSDITMCCDDQANFNRYTVRISWIGTVGPSAKSLEKTLNTGKATSARDQFSQRAAMQNVIRKELRPLTAKSPHLSVNGQHSIVESDAGGGSSIRNNQELGAAKTNQYPVLENISETIMSTSTSVPTDSGSGQETVTISTTEQSYGTSNIILEEYQTTLAGPGEADLNSAESFDLVLSESMESTSVSSTLSTSEFDTVSTLSTVVPVESSTISTPEPSTAFTGSSVTPVDSSTTFTAETETDWTGPTENPLDSLPVSETTEVSFDSSTTATQDPGTTITQPTEPTVSLTTDSELDVHKTSTDQTTTTDRLSTTRFSLDDSNYQESQYTSTVASGISTTTVATESTTTKSSQEATITIDPANPFADTELLCGREDANPPVEATEIPLVDDISTQTTSVTDSTTVTHSTVETTTKTDFGTEQTDETVLYEVSTTDSVLATRESTSTESFTETTGTEREYTSTWSPEEDASLIIDSEESTGSPVSLGEDTTTAATVSVSTFDDMTSTTEGLTVSPEGVEKAIKLGSEIQKEDLSMTYNSKEVEEQTTLYNKDLSIPDSPQKIFARAGSCGCPNSNSDSSRIDNGDDLRNSLTMTITKKDSQFYVSEIYIRFALIGDDKASVQSIALKNLNLFPGPVAATHTCENSTLQLNDSTTLEINGVKLAAFLPADESCEFPTESVDCKEMNAREDENQFCQNAEILMITIGSILGLVVISVFGLYLGKVYCQSRRERIAARASVP